MKPSDDRPLDTLSDDELLDRYGKLTGEAGNQVGADDFHERANIRHEMRRRGLITEDESTSVTPTVKWDGDGAGIDPSSGAVPPA